MTKIRFQRGSYAWKIIYFVALGVIFPWRSLKLIQGDHTLVLRCIRLLKENGYIIVQQKGRLKSIKLTKKAVDILDFIEPGLYEYYMYNSEGHTFRGVKVNDKTTLYQVYLRHFANAQVCCLNHRMDAKFLYQDKPQLRLTYTGRGVEVKDTYYYNSKELKNADPLQKHKTEFSRIIGMTVSQGGVYCIYNVGNSKIRWNQYGEVKAKLLVKNIVDSTFDQKTIGCSYGTDFKADSAIMFVDNFNVAAYYLSPHGRNRPDERGFEFLTFDNTFSEIYMLPTDDYGAILYKMITTSGWKKKIAELVFGSEYENAVGIIKDKNNTNHYMLQICDGNIGHLKGMLNFAVMNPSYDCTVYCYQWQKDAVKEIVGDTIDVSIIDFKETVSGFFLE